MFDRVLSCDNCHHWIMYYSRKDSEISFADSKHHLNKFNAGIFPLPHRWDMVDEQ